MPNSAGLSISNNTMMLKELHAGSSGSSGISPMSYPASPHKL
jgi:hypothetical protein